MIVTPDMHERKRLMFERSDAFVALPGGVGTLEELVEQMTWQQLGRHTKPVLLANIDGFWEPLIALLAHMRATEFIRPSLNIDVLKAERVEDIVPRLRAAAARARPKAPRKWRRNCARISSVARPSLPGRKRHGLDAACRRARSADTPHNTRYRDHCGRKRYRLSMRLPSGPSRRRRTFTRSRAAAPSERPPTSAQAGMERIDSQVACAHADMCRSRADLRHAGAQIDPELRIGFAEADRRWPGDEP